jgi:ATP-binding protein involved in chromosome partitioning
MTIPRFDIDFIQENVMTKIAGPLVAGRFSEHFGGAEAFGLFAVDVAKKSVLAKTTLQAPPHERGAFPRWLKEQGAQVILAGGMGPRAVQMFGHFGIEVVPGVVGSDPEAVVKAYLAGTLDTSGGPCSGGHLHGCGDHGHGGE